MRSSRQGNDNLVSNAARNRLLFLQHMTRNIDSVAWSRTSISAWLCVIADMYSVKVYLLVLSWMNKEKAWVFQNNEISLWRHLLKGEKWIDFQLYWKPSCELPGARSALLFGHVFTGVSTIDWHGFQPICSKNVAGPYNVWVAHFAIAKRGWRTTFRHWLEPINAQDRWLLHILYSLFNPAFTLIFSSQL